MFLNKEALRVLSLLWLMMRRTISFLISAKWRPVIWALLRVDQEKRAPFQFWALLFLIQKLTSAEIVRLFEESANLEKGEFFNDKCFCVGSTCEWTKRAWPGAAVKLKSYVNKKKIKVSEITYICRLPGR